MTEVLIDSAEVRTVVDLHRALERQLEFVTTTGETSPHFGIAC